MRYSRTFRFLSIAGLVLAAPSTQAADEDLFLGTLGTPTEQTMGYGRSAIWTLPLVATQYQPSHPSPAMQSALQAQQEGRYLDALIILDTAVRNSKARTEDNAELNLLRASFLLQGNQSHQALENLSPLLTHSRHAADAYALTAMALLQQGQMTEALDAAKRAHELNGDILPHMAHSYALQGSGHLAEAREAIHGFNTATPQSAITLAREAELALTLNQIPSARMLADKAHELDASHPYVTAVNGLVYLIDGQAEQAKAAFETALQRDRRDAKALLGLGLSEIKLGNLKAGQEKLQAANEADPGNALILTYLGRAQQQLGQGEAAKASWRRAQQADPKDPIPWLYQAQAQLQANHPLQARDSLREAQSRLAYRSVYRGESLLREDEQLLQTNLAEVQRQLGLENLAFQTLAGMVGANNSANLRNQADILQGQRFGESARRSLLLQSQFNAMPGNLPSELDIYGDGAGQTGATTPQHGVVSELGAQKVSYNNYDELFSRHTMLEADATAGTHDSKGAQIRLGTGNDIVGLSIAQRRFMTDGNAPFENLDNIIWQGTLQWQPSKSTQLFVSHQYFKSHRGETFYPAVSWGTYDEILENSLITSIGVRHGLTDDSELRGLWSVQKTDQANDYFDFSGMPAFSSSGSSNSYSAEVQYRRSGVGYASHWGALYTYGHATYLGGANDTKHSQQFYAAWQQMLNSYCQLDAGLDWATIDSKDNTGGGNDTYLSRWLPRLGLVYTPDAVSHLRIAAWQSMGVSGVGDAKLASVSLAGILLSRPGDNGQLVHAVALGGDRQLSPDWLLNAQMQRRKTEQPAIDFSTGEQILGWQKLDESSIALHWQPQGNPWAVKITNDYERILKDAVYPALDSVQEQHLHSQQMAMWWFVSAQWTINWSWSHNRVAGLQKSYDPIMYTPILIPYQDSFNQLDGNLSWQFNGSRGVLTVGVRNANNTRFQYADIDRLNPRYSNARLVYGKLKLNW